MQQKKQKVLEAQNEWGNGVVKIGSLWQLNLFLINRSRHFF